MASKKKKRANSGSATERSYNTYRFIDKDPIIDICRTARQDSGMSAMDIERASGLRAGTQKNWFEGGTRRPQYASVAAFLGACGYQLTVSKSTVNSNMAKKRTSYKG